mgnify:CR=1 FL=1|jgi:hypothetical protein
MAGSIGGEDVFPVGFTCPLCKERKQDVRAVPGDPTLYACLQCVPAGQEQTAVLQHRIKQLRREASVHHARYIAASEEAARLQAELDSLLESDPAESFRTAWQQAMAGDVLPVSQLWDGIMEDKQ